MANSNNNLTDVFNDIATAINGKGVTGTMTPVEMADKISAIPSGGGLPSCDFWELKKITVTTGINNVSNVPEALSYIVGLANITEYSAFNCNESPTYESDYEICACLWINNSGQEGVLRARTPNSYKWIINTATTSYDAIIRPNRTYDVYYYEKLV